MDPDIMKQFMAACIAATNPQAILELIAELERLEKEADWLADHVDRDPEDVCPSERCVEADECYPQRRCVKCWREAARRAVRGAR